MQRVRQCLTIYLLHTSSYQTTETGIHPTSPHLFTSLWRILWKTVRCQSKSELISLDLVHHPNHCVVVLSGICSKHVLDEFPYSGHQSALETTGTVPLRFWYTLDLTSYLVVSQVTEQTVYQPLFSLAIRAQELGNEVVWRRLLCHLASLLVAFQTACTYISFTQTHS